ncbi:AB hydrolase-1 domain-containing protein [Fusarium keratoplasticum]|uniref:AB hydrolase-1 domain-containing protein n=1 Tax=Fusarium keratoplasticum TaxID=1328300 RepID=A0ACC0RAP5_9HYPO|nr:AB hydrolase-1 domain-containing protein [Fusarium keratoplasticum]KAI8680477.1 AB hydrolase-1 domain-containing protein [Fusarium keratoplasticum]
MTVALHSGDLLADMIAVDNAPVAHILEDNFAGYIEGMHKVESANVTRRSQADKILEEHEKSPVVRQFLLGNLDRLESDGTLRFRIPLHILGQSWQNLGHFPYDNPCETEFDKPALFIRGTQSNYITDDDLVPISQFFPNFSLTDIDAGHWVISEQPEAFTKGQFAFTHRNGYLTRAVVAGKRDAPLDQQLAETLALGMGFNQEGTQPGRILHHLIPAEQNASDRARDPMLGA